MNTINNQRPINDQPDKVDHKREVRNCTYNMDMDNDSLAVETERKEITEMDKDTEKSTITQASLDNNNNKKTNNSDNNNNSNDSDVDDDYFADVGFMFEAQQPVRYERFQWDIPSIHDNRTTTYYADGDENDSTLRLHQQQQQQHEHDQQQDYQDRTKQTIQVGLHVADDNPGAIQSGHYLWPAAVMLSEYLIQNYSHPYSHTMTHHHNNNNIKTVIELGAGCALSSLTVLQLWKDTLQCICITDHDPGTLIRARDNYETTLQLLVNHIDDHCNNTTNNITTNTNTSDSNNDCNDFNKDERLNSVINNITSIPVLFESLEWGDTTTINNLLHNVVSEYVSSNLLLPKDHHRRSDDNNITEVNTNNCNMTDPSTTDSTTNNNNNNINSTSTYGYFDIVLGSDVIYSIDIVRPLFVTACTFMKHQPKQQSHTHSHQQQQNSITSRFILAQSFEYDIQIENEINQLCFEYNLQRTIKIDFDTATNNNDKTSNNDTTNAKWGRIQEFTFREREQSSNVRVEHDMVTSSTLPEIL
jgi:hypothetical protein